MPEFNAHGHVRTWAKPPEDQVQEFFDTLEEKYVRTEPRLVQDTTQAELDYSAAMAVEAELGKEAGSAGGVEDKATVAAEEKELAQWAESAGEANAPSVDREDIDTVIEDVAKDAAAEDKKITTEEAAKDATEGATNGHARESGKAAAKEADKAAAEEEAVDDQPSASAASGSGTASTGAPVEAEVFDDEVLAAAGLEVVAEPSAGGGGSQEERLLQAKGANFQKLRALHRARLDKAHKDPRAAQDVLAERDLALVMKQADIEKAEELVKQEAAQAEAARDLEAEKQQRKNKAGNHKDFVEGENRWIGRLEDVAGRITTQLATMGMASVRYTPKRNASPNAS
nr:uncharacterized protein LOC109741338 [Aegilops tauschii subsp. strangulata]